MRSACYKDTEEASECKQIAGVNSLNSIFFQRNCNPFSIWMSFAKETLKHLIHGNEKSVIRFQNKLPLQKFSL